MKKRFGRAAVIVLLPILLYGIVGPLEIYVGNSKEFNFEMKDFFGYFVLASILGLAIGTCILALIPKKVSKYLEGIICGLSFLSYLQNMFWNKKLINQDGSAMDWSTLTDYAAINIVIWILLFLAICLLPLYLKKYYDKILLGGSAFICLLQLTALVGLLVSAMNSNHDESHYALSGEKQYQVAAGNNVIIFVLDRYSNGVFDEMRQENAKTTEGLKDFVYYNNAECHYSFTFPSLAHILTGVNVDCSMTPDEWEEAIWQEARCEDYYSLLHSKGYECNFFSAGNVFSVLGNVGYLDGKYDNVVEAKPQIDHFLLVRLFEKMTIYRYVPYVIKPRFETLTSIFQEASAYVVENGVDYENVSFYESLKQKGLSINDETENEYRVIHLEGIHGPRTTTAEATYTDEGLYYDDKEPTEVETATGLSIILDEYIKQLKELDVYDNATIIITADHGVEYDPQPLFLVKLPNIAMDEMQVTSAPIMHDDLQATVLTVLGENCEGYGTSIFDWSEDSIRTRESWFPSEGFQVYSYEGNRYDLLEKMESQNSRSEGVETGWKHSW